ncbi:MAG: crossover junction endodeoxyribonuclease RuvC [Rhodoglobus sp.]
MRVLGIDPGLTRCGLGVVEVSPTRTVELVYVGVIRTPAGSPLEQRLHSIAHGIGEVIDEFSPAAVGVERMFAQHNLRTVMGTAQASGVALQVAASRGLSVGLHTPTEVKAALTGYGAAAKNQLGTMVARVLGLDAVPTPADAADALAIAICHAWRGPQPIFPLNGALTPAQHAWRTAEKSAAARGAMS